MISLIRNLNPNKATGTDGISGQILLLCRSTPQINLPKYPGNLNLP